MSADVTTSLTVPAAAVAGADHLVRHCGALQRGERVVIVCDPSTRELGALLADRARRVTADVELHIIPELSMHGEEPPADVARRMRGASLCLGVTAKSMAHTEARRQAAAAGGRYLSLPDYSMALLGDPAVQMDFLQQAPRVRALADRLSQGDQALVETAAGTHVRLRIEGRVGNCCPGFVRHPGDLGSPPDIEANVSPIETASEGTIVVDGSIPYPGLGLLEAPVIVRVAAGRLVEMSGPPSTVQVLREAFQRVGRPEAYVLAECGVGLNPLATLSGRMLTDEGTLGTMHFGFGSNATVGGRNAVPFHLDMVVRSATLRVDGRVLLDEGRIVDAALG